MATTMMLAAMLAGGATPATATAGLDARAVWSGKGVEACRSAGATRDCVLRAMRRTGATRAAIAFARTLPDGEIGYISGWRQAGPVGIATVTYPFRANTNDGAALIPPHGAEPLFVDAYRPTAADRARSDWRATMQLHPDVWPVAPGVVSAAKGIASTIRVRTPLAACHACAAVGAVTVAYRFDARGRFLGSGVERVEMVPQP